MLRVCYHEHFGTSRLAERVVSLSMHTLHGTVAHARMSLATLLSDDLIAIAPPWRSFLDTVSGLVDCMIQAGALPADRRGAVRDAVAAREAEGSTAVFEIGIGVPHARVPGLPGPAAALAIAPDGLYEAVPAVRIRIVALLVSPATATEAHLKLLASVATTLRSGALRGTLLGAATPADALRALRQHG
jgi:PTS system nitrogen regulatory IIA component